MTVDLVPGEANAWVEIQPQRRVDGIVERVLDGELVVYDIHRQRVHIFNPTAALIWSLCDGEHLPMHIVADLIDRFPEHETMIHEDVPAILQTFAAEGLLAA